MRYLFFLFFISCGIKSGTIKQKIFVPSHSVITSEYSPVFKMPIPKHYFYDDAYYFVIEKNGKQNKIEISKEKYNQLKIGDELE
jgi:hypothetical protein